MVTSSKNSRRGIRPTRLLVTLTMMRALLLGAAAYAGLASAYTGSSISTTSVVQCSTGYGSANGGVAPTPTPTSETTKTISSVFTLPATTQPAGYTRVTDLTVTTTQHTSLVVSIIFATVTKGIATSWVQPTTTIATASMPFQPFYCLFSEYTRL